MGIIADLLEGQIQSTRKQFSSSVDVLIKFQEQHWKIYHAIRDGQKDEAYQAVHEHFTYALQKMGFDPAV